MNRLLSGATPIGRVKVEDSASWKSARRVLERLADAGLEQIARRIAAQRRVFILDMLGSDRHKPCAAARYELWTVIYDSVPEMSYPVLGRMVDRDHTTVMYGVEKHRAMLDAEFARVA